MPELDLAAETAEAAGAYSARMTGGGFGGCVIALVDADAAGPVAAAVAKAFAVRDFTAPRHLPGQPRPRRHPRALTTVITLPPDFVAWAEGLPQLVAELCAAWDLRVEDRTALPGGLGLVVLVRRGGEPCALKLSRPEDGTAAAATALRAWDGAGAVRLYNASPDVGALLLERLEPGRSLHDLDLWRAAEVVGPLLRRLAIPAPPGLPTLAETAAGIAASLPDRQRRLGRPVPQPWLDAACRLCAELGPGSGGSLVHGDLHYGNVLAGRREPWLAVDPKAIDGDPEYSVPELMWTRADDLDGASDARRLLGMLVETAALDADAAHGWVVVRCVDYWLWGLEHGLTIDPVRCECVLASLLT